MEKIAMVNSILEWIELRLEQPLNVEIIAERSGYSKRSFHDIFKSVTGHNVATYIRQRRLSKSATMLLLSNKSIADIANLFQFESQAYYTRSFKKYFNQTPAVFRRGNINFENHQTPYHEKFDGNYIFEIVQIKEQYVPGTSYIIKLKISDTSSYPIIAKNCYAKVKREIYWAAGNSKGVIEIKTVIKIIPDAKNTNYLMIKYHIYNQNLLSENSIVIIPPGKYAKITYNGSWENYAYFSSKIYSYILPAHNVARRGNSVDFENFSFAKGCDEMIHCEYHVPIN